jgi:3-methylcrotonyl-CoA carboxylase alpha subunit
VFSRILIANRGEIACRVTRTARRMDVGVVAVYSDADARALHVALADEAFRVGTSAAADSYLRGDRIIEAARRAGAQAIHPGYGFLAENAEFAEACEAAGLVFIGPSAAAIRSMGDKAGAKSLMAGAGVPLVPGYHGGDQSREFLALEAGRIGYPVVIKACAGGGGKGMRVVPREHDFEAALAACRREAKSAFGDERVLLEKCIEGPRHVEVQVFADRHGGCVHLFDRDCSVQRRHQKIIEEAPAPGMSESQRRNMRAAAVAAARAVNYVGAGTVEFIVDRHGNFHFMEMNTRLQVEHPVTEMITGLDLVEWQLRVAAGERLPLAQEGLRIQGHAFEARVYAEDPLRDFLPVTGRLTHLGLPEPSRSVRVDSGVRPGDEITPYYDAMIAKVIVHGRDRGEALATLRAALADLQVAGLASNATLLRRIARCADFTETRLDTGLIERNRDELLAPAPAPDEGVAALAAASAWQHTADAARTAARLSTDPQSPWGSSDGWRLGGQEPQAFLFRSAGHVVRVSARVRDTGIDVELFGKTRFLRWQTVESGALRVQLDDAEITGRVVRSDRRFDVFTAGEHCVLELDDPLGERFDAQIEAGALVAPMPGRIVAVLVAAGATVEKGAPLLVLEAMKMEHTIAAPFSGKVARICFSPGEQVGEGALLVEFAPGEAT